MPPAVEPQSPRLAAQLRLIAAIALAALPLFFPIDLHFRRGHLAPVLPWYGVHAVLALAGLAASYRIRDPRRLGRTTLVLTVATAVNANLYAWYGHLDPAVTANLLTALMMGAAFIFPWRPAYTTLVCVATCGTFAFGAAFTPVTDAATLAYS